MKPPIEESRELTEHFFRHSYTKIIAVLVSHFGLEQISLVEDVVQDTLVSAMEQWSVKGIPENPGGWLMQVAKRKAINTLQRKRTYEKSVLPAWSTLNNSDIEEINDSTLKMMFTCCHPDLPPESQVSLALKTLCGLSVDEIANALLTTRSNINKRLYRAKQKFRTGSISFTIPESDDLKERLSNVCTTLFLLFNEGYYSLHHEDAIRMDLCYEAIRLIKQIEQNFPDYKKAKGLLALMLFNIARFESRLDDEGGLLILAEQDRSRWDQKLIAEGLECLHQSLDVRSADKYQLMAGIAAEHCLATDFQSTNWKSILQQYQILQKLDDNLLIRFNGLIAQFYAGQKEKALSELTALANHSFFEKNPLFFLTLAVLHHDLKDRVGSKAFFLKAVDLSQTNTERLLIENARQKYH